VRHPINWSVTGISSGVEFDKELMRRSGLRKFRVLKQIWPSTSEQSIDPSESFHGNNPFTITHQSVIVNRDVNLILYSISVHNH